MVEEIVWTSGACEDLQSVFSYLEDRGSGRGDAFVSSVDQLLNLLRLFPELSPRYRREVRRALVGSKRQYGLFYSLHGKRIFIGAVIDLRRAPDEIERILRERGID
jgi:plasmid stabilization system protein ParE